NGLSHGDDVKGPQRHACRRCRRPVLDALDCPDEAAALASGSMDLPLPCCCSRRLRRRAHTPGFAVGCAVSSGEPDGETFGVSVHWRNAGTKGSPLPRRSTCLSAGNSPWIAVPSAIHVHPMTSGSPTDQTPRAVVRDHASACRGTARI